MGASGNTTIDFGAFPGKSHATVAVTGQAGIAADSLVEAWIRPVATSDHAADEHIVDAPFIVAADIVAGAGFTIHGVARDGIPVPNRPLAGLVGQNTINSGTRATLTGDPAPMPYGLWTVAWVWN